jgi:hypothetical protein
MDLVLNEKIYKRTYSHEESGWFKIINRRNGFARLAAYAVAMMILQNEKGT